MANVCFGKITTLTDRGYGFITPDKGNKDIFFHCSALPEKSDFDGLEEGWRVSYSIEQTDSGRPKAVSIQVIS